ncbi:MAG: hypothetical protein ABIY51_11460 [Ferruginibacter sp.]
MNKLTTFCLLLLVSVFIGVESCSKSSVNPPATDPCAGKTITLTGTTTATTTPFATNGTVSATAAGSTGFTYSLNGGASQATGSFAGLAQGIYTVTAKDASGCTGSQSFTVAATACPAITVTAVVTPATTGASGSIVATATGSTGITYSIGAGGVFQASGTFSNLVAGSYNITAKDANGCLGSASFTVTSASCPTITLTTTFVNTTGPTATNGSITASATGGVAPYTFSKDNGVTFQASGTFSNLAVNTYGVVAKDANGCLSTSINVVVGATCPTINTNAATTTTVKCEAGSGTITITAIGSTGLTYNINGGVFQASNVFNTLVAGSYTYGVKDANGCTATGNATIAQAPAGSLFTNVKVILVANCTSCHGGPFPQNGLNFNDDCTIVAQSARIKSRAVDANPSQMPPSGPALSATDKAAIVNWINAGGKHNN